MHASVSNQTWTGRKQAVVETLALGTLGSPIAGTIGPVVDRGGGQLGKLRVLARLPDLGKVTSVPLGPSGSSLRHVRIISQGLAAKLLLGGTVLLMAAAVLPTLFGGKAAVLPGQTDTSAWQPAEPPPAGMALTVSLSGVETVQAPAEVATAAAAPASAPPLSPSADAVKALGDSAKVTPGTDGQPALQPAMISPQPVVPNAAPARPELPAAPSDPLAGGGKLPAANGPELSVPNQPLLLAPNNTSAPSNTAATTDASAANNVPAASDGREESVWPRPGAGPLAETPRAAENQPMSVNNPPALAPPQPQSEYPRNALREGTGQPSPVRSINDVARPSFY
jgi:hypothetical protein